MRVIAIINQKGGCGKTTTSINVSACMARLGQRTLLVDLDPQGHCTVGLAVPEEQVERSIFETLIEPTDGKVARMPEVVWQIASDFDLAPSNLRLAAFEQLFAGRAGRENRLASALAQVHDRYKFAILDCPPSVGLITFNALKACDEVVVPVETGFFSLHGLTKMLQTLEVMKEKAGKDVRVRILPTLYDTRTKLAREVLSELRAKFKSQLMESTVNFNTKLKEAASFGQPITEYDPGSRGYKDFVNLARELMGQQAIDVEVPTGEPMSRPMELVQRAKALANLTNIQFGRNTVQMQPQVFATPRSTTGETRQPIPASEVSPTITPREPVRLPEPVTLRDQMPAGEQQITPAREPTPTTHGLPVHHAPPSFELEHAMSSDRQELTGPMSIMAPMPVAISLPPTAPAPSMAPATLMPASLMLSIASEAPMSMISSAPTSTMSLMPEVADVGPIFETRSPHEPVRAKTTDEKLAEFYGVKRMGGEVLFAARFEEAMRVEVAGDFNNWSPGSTPMLADTSGRWVTTLPLRTGRYRYRLVVDGQWMTDPNNSYVESNQFGELNNIVEVD